MRSLAAVSLAPRPRVVLGVVPGLFARQDFRGLVEYVALVQLVLLLVAVTIDLANYYDQVMSLAPPGVVAALGHFAWYLGLRLVDMVTRMLPIAV